MPVARSWGALMLAYEDNFGFWEIYDSEEQEFFDSVWGQGIRTVCERCQRPVRLIIPRTTCASCVCALEYGAPTLMTEYE
jgi:hypothetical protein